MQYGIPYVLLVHYMQYIYWDVVYTLHNAQKSTPDPLILNTGKLNVVQWYSTVRYL